ncbi:MAG: MazG-like family protein [bacterium]|nr:MazG-like family protein [bacterium]
MRDAQVVVKEFAQRRGWIDVPDMDKFDHLHEELIEMSRVLRYQSREAMQRTVVEQRDVFVDGIGDLFFGTCRLANQLGVDIEDAFDIVRERIAAKYPAGSVEQRAHV